MDGSISLVIFELGDGCRYALHLEAVLRVTRAVAITPLPKAPGIVLGAINIQGSVVPVVSLRQRFQLPERPLQLDDQVIVARTARRTLGLLVSRVLGVVSLPAVQWVPHETLVPGLEYVRGIAKIDDTLVCIHDLDACLSLDEEHALSAALEAGS